MSIYDHSRGDQARRGDTVASALMEGKMKGRRVRGRPVRQWEDDMKDWTGLRMVDAMRVAMDRVTWRRNVRV